MSTEEPHRPSNPRIELLIDPGNASVEEIRSLLNAISDLHVMAGGLGLEFSVEGNCIFITERELA